MYVYLLVGASLLLIIVVPRCVASLQDISSSVSLVLYLSHWCQEWDNHGETGRDYERRLQACMDKI